MLSWALWLGAGQRLFSAGTAGTRGWEQRQNSSVAQSADAEPCPGQLQLLCAGWSLVGSCLPWAVGQVSTTGIHPCCLWGLHFSLWLCSGSCSSSARWKLQCWVLLHSTSFAARIPFPSFPHSAGGLDLDWIFKLINASNGHKWKV